MPDAPKPPRVTTLQPVLGIRPAPDVNEKMVCERCSGANVYRMHAVWRCSDGGLKTECCGW